MSLSSLTIPVLTINQYLWHTMKVIEPGLSKKYGTTITPFFPISDGASGKKSWENKPYVIYDRMFQMRANPFYPIKKEHILYSVKGREQDTLEWGAAIQYILDRGDDVAQDINAWNCEQDNPAAVHFHCLNVFQNNFTQTRDFSNRTYFISQFIVKADYHLNDLGTFNLL